VTAEAELVSPPPGNRLLIVDGHAYAYRAFFAIRRLHSPTGEPTNAIYGFIKMLERMTLVVQPTHRVVIWDGGLAAERMELLPSYKAQRPSTPPDLEAQFDQIVAYLQAAGVASFCQDGVEADDWIATVARQAEPIGLAVVIASSDKDFMQLVSDRVFMLNPNDKTESLLGVAKIQEKTGVTPAQVVDWLSLIGDNVDNIPGVPGVGPKTATDLLRQFGTIEAMYQRLGEVSSERVRNALTSAAENVRRNQRLIRLNADLPYPFSADEVELRGGDPARLRELYSRWGFKTMLKTLEAALPASSSQPDLF